DRKGLDGLAPGVRAANRHRAVRAGDRADRGQLPRPRRPGGHCAAPRRPRGGARRPGPPRLRRTAGAALARHRHPRRASGTPADALRLVLRIGRTLPRRLRAQGGVM
ncbi:MAG: hypothetical protein AVDCRST_MAG08-4394, partial [uncultured Acetobacteraceae bacterium]